MFTGAALRNRRESGVGVDMAATRTVLQLQDVVVNHRGFYLLVRTLFEIASMAAGAIGFIGSKPPGNDLAVVRMAGATKHAGSMSFVESALMRIGRDRCPGYPSTMAGIT